MLDSIFNKSLLLHAVHHVGYAAVLGLLLAVVFNFIEARRPGWGFNGIYWIFVLLLVTEGFLTNFFITHYEALEAGLEDLISWRGEWVATGVMLLLSAIGLKAFHLMMARFYGLISRMYPLTFILFSFFLASLMAAKRPVNENKTQHLLESVAAYLMESNDYEIGSEYPLMRPYTPDKSLVPYFALQEEKPHLVMVIVDGLGDDFVGNGARYQGFMPFLDSLAGQSLQWKHFLSNTGVAKASLASITGSLPFGDQGFTQLDHYVNRQTIFSILRKNGYTTHFHYGGNTALDQWDRYLAEEGVDVVYDDKGFGGSYRKQEADAAGNSLGYPDKALFRRWDANAETPTGPRAEFFFTLSSKAPFLAPQQEAYARKVVAIAGRRYAGDQKERLITKNRKLFASLLYADDAHRQFFSDYRQRPEFSNTIFLVTGSHNMNELPHGDRLQRYRVPLLVYSPMLQSAGHLTTLASHADILPSLAGLLDHSYSMEMPSAVAWLGQGLIHEQTFREGYPIPLFRYPDQIREFVWSNYFLSGDRLQELDDHLSLTSISGEGPGDKIRQEFGYFKAVNAYVTRRNKLLPPVQAPLAGTGAPLSKQEMVWVQSVLNSTNYDNAYQTARSLSLEGETARALLLCRHILNRAPGHVDTEILMGRIQGWEGNYQEASAILEGVVRKYPVYADGYQALLDVYYWGGEHQKALSLEPRIRENHLLQDELVQKLQRARDRISAEEGPQKATTDTKHANRALKSKR